MKFYTNRYSVVTPFKYTDNFNLQIQFALRVADIGCQSLRGKTNSHVKPVDLVTDLQ